MTTLDKLNDNLKIAQANKNLKAIEIIQRHIDTELSNVHNTVSYIEEPCKYRGKLIFEKSCKCANGRIWECDILGQVVERLCGKTKCKKYEPK